MQPLIRDYIDKDFNEVNKLWNDTGMGGAVRGDNNEVIKRTLIAGGRLRIMQFPGSEDIIGTSWLTTDHRRTYLHHFGILPAYQGKGLSKILLEDSLKIAKETGYQIKLEVHENNMKALQLYKKYGFKYLGDYLVYIIRSFDKKENE